MNKQTFPIPPNCKSITQELDLENHRIITTFEPNFKRGDILTGEYKHKNIIILDKISDNYIGYICRLSDRTDVDIKLNCYESKMTTDFKLRHATDPERQSLFNALSEEGKQWNAEKCCIEDLKIVPKVGDCVKCHNKETPNDHLYFVCGGFDKDGDPYEKNGCAVVNSEIVIEYLNIGYFGEDYAFEIISKDQFQKELSELGFEYNFKDDTINELKWSPKDGEDCYCLDFSSVCGWECRKQNYSKVWESFYLNGRVFKAKEECEEVITKIKNILK